VLINAEYEGELINERFEVRIMELLASWHDAKSKMMSAWSAVPAHRRSALQSPPVEDRRLSY
jgi:hypothetical protein